MSKISEKYRIIEEIDEYIIVGETEYNIDTTDCPVNPKHVWLSIDNEEYSDHEYIEIPFNIFLKLLDKILEEK